MSRENIDLTAVETSHYLPQFMEAVNNAVWLVDADLRLIAQNNSAREILGWSPAEAVGRHLCDLIPAEDGAFSTLRESVRQAIEENRPVSLNGGIYLGRKRKRPILMSGRIAPLKQPGQPTNAICAFWETAPEKDDAYLKFEFANMASHLFRTPLSFIHASLDFLMTSELPLAEQQLILGRMQKQSQRLIRFTHELLKMLRLETESTETKIEPVALLPLIAQVVPLVQADNPNHTFTIETRETLSVAANPTKVEVILLNLLLNAIKRCPDKGHIKIELQQEAHEVVVSITDNGCPIPTKLLERVFWQFYPIDDEYNKMPSTYRLGLYNTKRLVELQNGRIWVESLPGKDPQFSFSLPTWG